jgi:hypothetical protein
MGKNTRSIPSTSEGIFDRIPRCVPNRGRLTKGSTLRFGWLSEWPEPALLYAFALVRLESISKRGLGRWGVIHLDRLARSWNTILSPRFTVSTSGFGGFTRCSGVAFSYIRQHPRRPALSHQRTLLPQNVRTELNATWNGNSMVAIWEYRRWGIVDLNVMKLKTTS